MSKRRSTVLGECQLVAALHFLCPLAPCWEGWTGDLPPTHTCRCRLTHSSQAPYSLDRSQDATWCRWPHTAASRCMNARMHVCRVDPKASLSHLLLHVLRPRAQLSVRWGRPCRSLTALHAPRPSWHHAAARRLSCRRLLRCVLAEGSCCEHRRQMLRLQPRPASNRGASSSRSSSSNQR
jgi:hypothetical protein